MMRTALIGLAICCLVAGQAAADGKFFSVSNDVRQPDQKALLWHDGGRETLILQTKYEGASGDFGWVVPVPSRPKLDVSSPEVFSELAWLTRPIHVRPWWGSRSQRFVVGAGAISPVSVVQEAEVGPYDATVLSATRAGALADWLRKHGYALPPEAARVLKSYVDRQWYYVAVRIDAQRVHDQLLTDLQQIDPGIESLEEAPDRLALLVMRTADVHPMRGRELLSRLSAITDEAQGGAATSHEPLFGEPTGISSRAMLTDFDEYYPRRRDLLKQIVTEPDLAAYCSTLAKDTGLSLARIAEIAKAMGRPGAPADAGALCAALTKEVVGGVPWEKASLARLVERVSRAGSRPSRSAVLKLRYDYDLRRQILQEHARTQYEGHAQPEALADNTDDVILSDPERWSNAARRLTYRWRLYAAIQSAVQQSAEAVETALSAGAITPLRLDFASDDLVYPLYITSLNDAPVDVQIYVLSGHRMKAEGFETTFAARLDDDSLERAPETAKLVGDGRDYLTELRAKLAPKDMSSDLFFARARSDRPYQEKIYAQAGLDPLVVVAGILLPVPIVVALAVIYSRARRRFARHAEEKAPPPPR